MEKVSWVQNGPVFRRVVGNIANVDSIPVGIYSIKFNPMEGWSLEQTGEKFTFDYKVYGLQQQFVQHVLKTFKNTKGNLGILLNGVKGTGKIYKYLPCILGIRYIITNQNRGKL